MSKGEVIKKLESALGGIPSVVIRSTTNLGDGVTRQIVEIEGHAFKRLVDLKIATESDEKAVWQDEFYLIGETWAISNKHSNMLESLYQKYTFGQVTLISHNKNKL